MRILMSLKTNHVEVLIEAKFVIAQSPQVNVVWKFGDSLDCASKLHEGFLATDHVILNHGQVTWTTPELAPPFPNYLTTPTGERFSSR
ncbi:hypothetical protein TNCV_4186661 [Trichonephila clavipes]|nr:hypothetical protein TNCV_4186661 [Trichonephila clavipes]